jgi:hypothetical protein
VATHDRALHRAAALHARVVHAPTTCGQQAALVDAPLQPGKGLVIEGSHHSLPEVACEINHRRQRPAALDRRIGTLRFCVRLLQQERPHFLPIELRKERSIVRVARNVIVDCDIVEALGGLVVQADDVFATRVVAARDEALLNKRFLFAQGREGSKQPAVAQCALTDVGCCDSVVE